MTERIENMRQLVDMAMSCARKRQSAQTGYIHYCHHLQDEEPHLPIPIVENFLFALALLRSRTIENVNEARTILDGLLHFQNQSEESMAAGNFPIYMHEYPICKDRFTGVQAAMAIFWILKQFHQVVGQDLKKRLEGSFVNLLAHALKTHSEKPAPYAIAIKIAALAKSGGILLLRQDFEAAGQRMLDQLHANRDPLSWYCPASLGAILSALAMVYPRLSESPWADFWKFLGETWHRHTCAYVGPAFKEWQYGEEPQVTLYDYFLGYFSGGFSERALQDSLVHLETTLIPAYEDVLATPHYPVRIEGSYGEVKWHLFHNKLLAYCFIEKSPEINPVNIKGFHPMRIVWGDRQRVHTFVCQGGNSKATEFAPVPNGVDIIFELSNAVEVEDREKSRETIFFIDIHEGLDMLISGQKATTFALGEEIMIRSGACGLLLTFHLQEGDGRFLGHRMLGNRQSQLNLKGKRRYHAYDWQIFMRTVQRSDLCVVKAELRIAEEV